MTQQEFAILHAVERIGESQGLIPRGATVRQIKDVIYDEGDGEFESAEITSWLLGLRRRKLVISKPGPKTALWMCTLYGANVVSA